MRERIEHSCRVHAAGNLREFARQVDVPYTWIHGFLRVRPERAPGSTTIDIARLMRVACALGLSLEALGAP